MMPEDKIEVWLPSEHTMVEELAHAQRLAIWLYRNHIEKQPYDHAAGINLCALELSLRRIAESFATSPAEKTGSE
jgi:hypothetical protein